MTRHEIIIEMHKVEDMLNKGEGSITALKKYYRKLHKMYLSAN